jgi:protein-tyrosine phosphatase
LHQHISSVKRSVKTCLEDLWWTFHGRSYQNPPLPRMAKSTMFVCAGNIIRSIFAEELSRSWASEKGLEHVEFSSSGLSAKPGTPSPTFAVEAAKSFGVNLQAHSSKKYDPEKSDRIDMVICMEAGQYSQLRRISSNGGANIYLLPLFQGKQERIRATFACNIPDPYGRPREAFDFTFSMIEHCLRSLYSQLSTREGVVPMSGSGMMKRPPQR